MIRSHEYIFNPISIGIQQSPAALVDRARRAEITDPAPDHALEKCLCDGCQAHYFGVRWETLTGGSDDR